MNSLYISYDGALEPLGQSQIIPYLLGLAESASKKIILLTFDKPGFASRQARESLRLKLDQAGILWASLKYHRRPAVISTFFDIAAGSVCCSYFVIKHKVGIVHARGYVSAMIACILKKIFKVKFIFDMRGFWADLKAECGQWRTNGVIYKVTKYLEAVFLKDSDSIIVLTKKAKLILEQEGYRHCGVSVIPCCVSVDRFALEGDALSGSAVKKGLNDKFVFAHTGSLEPWYMMDEMLDFFKTAKGMIANAHFLILSRSPKDRVLRLISERGLDPDDFSMEAADFTDMPLYLADVKAGLIFLSLSFSKAGCSPTKFAEFLSCGIPVVATPGIGDLDEIIAADRVGVVIRPSEPDCYKQGVLELLSLIRDGGLTQRCRNAALKYFSLAMGIERYKDVYKGLGVR